MNIENYTPQDVEDGRLPAILCYIPFLCIIPLLKPTKNRYIQLHAKQGLLLLVLEVTSLIFLVDSFSHLFWIIILVCCAFFALRGIFYAFIGNFKQIPYIGHIFKKYEI